ncbi:hypothetical protein IGB42_01906 [Andreprevotia sp. IGB-42]|nr:hypothetical protein IGB42_01906 [Andreprevotia sp. IGB-42]
MKSAFVFSLLVSAATAGAAGTTAPVAPKLAPADVVTRLFAEACLGNLGKNDAASAWAKKNRLQPVEGDFSKVVLDGEAGEVWGVGGEFLLVLRGQYQCAAWARTADAKQVEKNLTQLVKGTAKPGLVVKQILDKSADKDGSKYHQLGFSVAKEGASSGFVVLATTSSSPKAEAQARLSVSPAKF